MSKTASHIIEVVYLPWMTYELRAREGRIASEQLVKRTPYDRTVWIVELRFDHALCEHSLFGQLVINPEQLRVGRSFFTALDIEIKGLTNDLLKYLQLYM